MPCQLRSVRYKPYGVGTAKDRGISLRASASSGWLACIWKSVILDILNFPYLYQIVFFDNPTNFPSWESLCIGRFLVFCPPTTTTTTFRVFFFLGGKVLEVWPSKRFFLGFCLIRVGHASLGWLAVGVWLARRLE